MKNERTTTTTRKMAKISYKEIEIFYKVKSTLTFDKKTNVELLNPYYLFVLESTIYNNINYDKFIENVKTGFYDKEWQIESTSRHYKELMSKIKNEIANVGEYNYSLMDHYILIPEKINTLKEKLRAHIELQKKGHIKLYPSHNPVKIELEHMKLIRTWFME